jgi:hypothetical protein
MTTRHRLFSMAFARVYPAYVQKAERKQRTQAEVVLAHRIHPGGAADAAGARG